ncbi:MAG: hypothetical protein K6T30_04590 [Alicyclobacillus sp.]|nr:hypothetical protein [Alicyclobacillus sp.]
MEMSFHAALAAFLAGRPLVIAASLIGLGGPRGGEPTYNEIKALGELLLGMGTIRRITGIYNLADRLYICYSKGINREMRK